MKHVFMQCLLLFLTLGFLATHAEAQKKSCSLEVRGTEANEGGLEDFFYFDPDAITDYTPPLATIRLRNVATGEGKSPSLIRDIGTVGVFTNVVAGRYLLIVTAYGYKPTVKEIRMPSCTYPTYKIETKLYDRETHETISSSLSSPKPGKHISVIPTAETKLVQMKWSDTVSPNSLAKFPKEDPGVDLAVVTRTKAYLRQNADLLGDIEQELDRGDLLALIDRRPTAYMYNVIHIRTGKEGWIKSSHIDIKYTENPKPAPTFEERRTYSDLDPELVVENGTDRILSLRLGKKLLTIAPNTEQRITVPAGKYRYYGSVPKALPCFGERIFPNGIIFTWRFYLIRR